MCSLDLTLHLTGSLNKRVPVDVQMRFADGHVYGRLPWLLADIRRPSPLWEALLPRLGSELYKSKEI